MDTSSTPTSSEASTSSLTTEQAGSAFAAMLDPVELKEPAKVPEGAEPAKEGELEGQPNAQEEGEEAPMSEEEGNEIVTVLVDGKPVELTKAQIAEAHKSGLRQADYTKKTTELAEQRKTAEAETAKAREERNQYAQGLQRNQALLEASLQEQQNIDWQALLDSDPVGYLKQQHLFQQRQAALQQTYQQQQAVHEQAKAEQESSFRNHILSQREELLAKVPEWKDEAKMKAGVAEVKAYLLKAGYTEAEISSVHDHRAVLNVRKAMLYDQMMSKASAAAKKVQQLPQRVERSAGGESAGLDKRQAAFQRLNKSGRVEDAGAVFASLLS